MKVGVLGNGSIGHRHISNALDLGHDVRSYDPITGQTIEDKRTILDWADKLVIATPTERHLYDIIEGKNFRKPMLVEKPIAHAVSPVLTNEHVRMVGYNLRFHPLIKLVKRALEEGKIGTVQWASFTLGQLTTRPAYARDGVILNWSHEIDLALYLLGTGHLRAASVRRTDGHDDIADLLVTHTSNCRTTIHLDYVSNPWTRCGTLTGERDYIHYDLESGTADICGTMVSVGNDAFNVSYREELKAFLEDTPGHPGCTATQAVEVLELCMKARGHDGRREGTQEVLGADVGAGAGNRPAEGRE